MMQMIDFNRNLSPFALLNLLSGGTRLTVLLPAPKESPVPKFTGIKQTRTFMCY